MLHPKPPPFLARLKVAGSFVGTAFAVGKRELVTCRHVAGKFGKDSGNIVVFDENVEGGKGRLTFQVVIGGEHEGDDIALLIADSDLPARGAVLVDGYEEKDFRRFLLDGARISGYSDKDLGEKLTETTISGSKGNPAIVDGVVSSFQIEGGIWDGMSGAPCIVTAKDNTFIIGMSLTGGRRSGHTGLISSNCLISFLNGFRTSNFAPQTVSPKAVFALSEEAQDQELSTKLGRIADSILEATEEIDLVGRKARLLSRDPSRRLFQPLPLVRELSEEEQSLLIGKLAKHPTASEMGAFEAKRAPHVVIPDQEMISGGFDAAVDQRVKEFLYQARGSAASSDELIADSEIPKTETNAILENSGVSLEEIFETPGMESAAPRVVFLGSPGGGKSVLLKYLAQKFAHGAHLKFRGRKVLPLFIRLASWSDFAAKCHDPSIETFLAEEYPDLAADEWLQQLSRGNVLLLLDGLDEIHDPDERFVTAGLKRSLAKYKDCPAALSSRTIAFPLYRPILKGYTVYQLGRLSGPQILEYTRAYAAISGLVPGVLEHTIQAALENPSMLRLAGNPLLLSVMCFVASNDENGAQPMAVRAQLFDRAVNQLLARRRQRVPSLSPSLVDFRRTVLARASLDLFERRAGQEKAIVLDSAMVTRSFRAAATSSGLPPDAGTEILRDTVERGLLQRHDDQTMLEFPYTYLHLQFHEYLAGCGLIADADFANLVFDRLSSPRWREVILLAIGQLAIEGRHDENKFLETVRALLNYRDPFAPFLPRAALLLVTAIPDLSVLPGEMVDTLAGKIIESYADIERIRSFPDLAQQLEQAFSRIAELDGGERVLPILLECLSLPAEDLNRAMAAASLIKATRLHNSETIAALIAAYQYDQSSWDWPIDTALQDVAADEKYSDALDADVPFRRLRDDPQGWTRFSADPFWHWVALTVLGGVDSTKPTKAKEVEQKIDEAKRSLERELAKPQADQKERERIENEIKAAEENVRAIYSQMHQLAPQYFHRPSPLSSGLWEAFQQERPASNILEELFARLPEMEDEHEQIDAILILAFSVPVVSLVEHARDSSRLSAAITRLDLTLKISVESALNGALGADEGVLSLVEGRRRNQFIAAVARATSRYTESHPVTLAAAKDEADPEAKASRVAEFLQRSMLAQSDDRIYNWCVVLDTVGKKIGGDPEVLVRALALAHQAGNARPWFPKGWPLDPLAPRLQGKPLPVLLGQALDALDAMPDIIDFVRGWALARLAPLFRQAGMLFEPKLLTLLTVTSRFNARADTFEALCGGGEWRELKDGRTMWAHLEVDFQSEANNPYIRSRSLIASTRMWTALGFDLVPGLASVKSVADPVVREWLLERLHQMVEPSEQAAILAAARDAALEIPWDDGDNKTRAVLRLAAFAPSMADEALREHLKALDQELVPFDTAQPELRAQSLACLRPYVRGRLDLLELFDAAIGRLSEARLKLAACGFVAPELADAIRAAPEKMTILGVAAAVSDFRHALQVPDDLDGVWLALASPDRSLALARLTETAKPNGLRLTSTGTLALGRVIHTKDWPLLRRILPLVRQVDPLALPLIAKLRESDDPFIRSHAALLCAESIGLRRETLPSLIELLKSDEYLIRCRAALAMHGDRTEEAVSLYASRVGSAGLEAIAAYIDKEPDVRITLVLSWTLERFVFDDPELIRKWVSDAASQSAASRFTLRLLGRIESVTRESWMEMLRAFEASPPAVKQSLLKSICRQASRGSLEGQSLDELSELLTRVDISGAADIFYLENSPAEIIAVSSEALRIIAEDSGDRRSIASHCRHLYFAKKQSLSATLQASAASELRTHLAIVGSLTKAGAHYYRQLSDAATQIEERPEVIRILVPWLLEELISPATAGATIDRPDLCGDLLGITAEAAERFPAEFREVAGRFPTLAKRISEAVRKHGTFTGRQAALRLLAVLGRIDSAVAGAFYESLKDLVPVQTTAFRSLRSYREIDGKFISAMLEKLGSSTCATTCYLISRALATVAHNVFLRAEFRSQIVTGCREALMKRDLQEDVYVVETSGQAGSEVYRLKNLGRLDQLLYANLLELSGVALHEKFSK